MIVITGAAGFIGSFLVNYLNEKKIEDLILVDDFTRPDKFCNLIGRRYIKKIEREFFLDWLNKNKPIISCIMHLGARTDTTENNWDILDKLNLKYSQNLWNYCSLNNIPFIYASSAATYGAGEMGYIDNHDIVPLLKPLNLYGQSKNLFDLWVLQQRKSPPFWAGLKFFNVFGPNEYHKGRMASVIFHAYNQIVSKGKVSLFRSHRFDYKDGEQKRDFIYVKDVIKVCEFLRQNTDRINSGLYNVGTGLARTFKDLVLSVFMALKLEPHIVYIDMPIDIRDKYQYFTQADMQKLKKVGYNNSFFTLEKGIAEYVQDYLAKR